MENRSELFTIFPSYYQQIKNQFVIPICTLQSDNTREYLSHEFQQFMDSHSILHCTSYAYTPQQNGIVEHKNQHLMDTTRTLLFHRISFIVFGAMSFSPHATLLIACLPPFLTTKYFTPFYFLIKIFTLYLRVLISVII